jgi:soluble lytic murein transglycosylase-like protein
LLVKRWYFIFFGVIWGATIFFAQTVPAKGEIYAFKEDGAIYYTNQAGAGRVKINLPLKKGVNRYFSPPTILIHKEYQALITQAGQQFDLDPLLISAVIKAESNFDHKAVSPKGAQGLMQLMPQTAKELGVLDPFDPADNILGGVKYLSRLMNQFGGDYNLALAAYNAGPARVQGKKEIPSIPETRNYVQRVMNYYKKNGAPAL